MKQYFRSVWISDVHLCTRDSQAEKLHAFLDSITCEYLYLVGDIIDVWALKKSWYWPDFYNEVVHKFLKHARRGTEVVYIPGNHDEAFRQFVGYRFGNLRIAGNAVHQGADGRKFLVVHGDEFDTVVQEYKWLAKLGGWAYGYVITLNRMVNAARRSCGRPYWSFSGVIKRRVKQAVKFITRFEDMIVDEARRQCMDGVICGHIHKPVMRDTGGVLYLNTGDWVEHCTAVVESPGGELSILSWNTDPATQADDHPERRPRGTTASVVIGGIPVNSLGPMIGRLPRGRVIKARTVAAWLRKNVSGGPATLPRRDPDR